MSSHGDWPSTVVPAAVVQQPVVPPVPRHQFQDSMLIENVVVQPAHVDWPPMAGHHRGQFASIVGGTLGRAPSRNPHFVASSNPAAGGNMSSFHGYPLYHTCERPSASASKKRVTIVEDNNTESSV